MIRLASRASAISRTMETIEHQQRGSGIGMRADMAAARESMESFMDEAKASLASQDFDASKRNMDIAERQIEKLEAFLGR